MRKRVYVGVAFGFLASWASGALAASPNAAELMSRSVKVTEQNWAQAPNYSFARTQVSSKRGSAPVKKTFEVVMIQGTPFSKLIAEDGRPLSRDRAKEQDQKLRLEASSRNSESPRERQRRIAKYNEDREQDHKILVELSQAFNFTISGEQKIDGRDTWILHGTPRPHYVPKTREAKVLVGMEVKFWVDKQTYQWPRIEAEVKMPVSLYMVGKVYPGTRFVLQQEPVSSNTWLPKYFQVEVKATAFGFVNENSSTLETYSDYRRVAQVPTPGGKARSELR